MKKLIILITCCFSSFIFAQKLNLSKGAPTFYESSINQSYKQKTQNIKNKTQLFISKKIGVDFVKKILKPGDSIEFDYQYVIGVNGHPTPNLTKVNTEYEFFNNKISRIINILPEFIPAITITTKKPYPFPIKLTAEFYVNESFSLIPIYRKPIDDNFKLTFNDKQIDSCFSTINHKDSRRPIFSTTVYFSTGSQKNLKNIRILNENLNLKNIITESIKKLDSVNPDLFSKLEHSKNYSLNCSIYKESSKFYFPTPDRHAIFKGCNDNLDNNKVLKCTSKKISKHINRNFNTDLAKDLGITGRQKIFIGFKIDTEGNVFDANARATHPKLKEEAIRVIKLIPKMKPAYLNGKPIVTPYAIPLIFTIEPDPPRRNSRYHNSRRY